MIHSNIKRWGNSPAVRIPAIVMQALNLNIDDEIKIELVEDRLIIEPVKQKALFSLTVLQMIICTNRQTGVSPFIYNNKTRPLFMYSLYDKEEKLSI